MSSASILGAGAGSMAQCVCCLPARYRIRERFLDVKLVMVVVVVRTRWLAMTGGRSSGYLVGRRAFGTRCQATELELLERNLELLGRPVGI